MPRRPRSTVLSMSDDPVTLDPQNLDEILAQMPPPTMSDAGDSPGPAAGDPEVEPAPEVEEPPPLDVPYEDDDDDDDDGDGYDAGIPVAAAPPTPPVPVQRHTLPVAGDNTTNTLGKPTVVYLPRIQVMEAWRYQGRLADAPDFVDRNWASYGDYDEIRNLPPGPALRIPVPRSITRINPSGIKLARIGDYVVRQAVTLAEGMEPEVIIDVWDGPDFERMFIPHAVTTHGATKRRKPDADAA